MADIKQAGRWLEEGKFVGRSTWGRNARIGSQPGFKSLLDLYWDEGVIVHTSAFVLSISDLLTEDWEIRP